MCGMMCALSGLLMLTGAIPLAEYCGPVLAMLPQLPVAEAWGGRWALGVYAGTCCLGLMLVPQPEAVLAYLCLGWYPALRPRLELLPGWRRRGGKLVAFAAGTAAFYLGSRLLLGPGASAWWDELSPAMTGLLLALAAAVYGLLDLAIGRLRRAWGARWRRWMLR